MKNKDLLESYRKAYRLHKEPHNHAVKYLEFVGKGPTLKFKHAALVK